jgi:hypothetical protein
LNLKLAISISKRSKESIINYFKESGYAVTEKKDGEWVVVSSDAPGYGDLTPVIEENSSGIWFCLRLPRKEKKK